MNIVIIKHAGDNGHYIFSVPDGKSLQEGDFVLARSRRGETSGVCVCDSFEIGESPLKALLSRYGGKEPLCPVIGRFALERWEDETHE